MTDRDYIGPIRCTLSPTRAAAIRYHLRLVADGNTIVDSLICGTYRRMTAKRSAAGAINIGKFADGDTACMWRIIISFRLGHCAMTDGDISGRLRFCSVFVIRWLNFDIWIFCSRPGLYIGERIADGGVGFTADGIAWLFDSAILIQPCAAAESVQCAFQLAHIHRVGIGGAFSNIDDLPQRIGATDGYCIGPVCLASKA